MPTVDITTVITKEIHPEASLDYIFDWSPWLDGDTLSTSAWEIPAGLTKVSETYTDTTATIFITPTVASGTLVVVNSIETALGRKESKSIRFKIVNTGG